MKFRDNPEEANRRLMALVEEMNGESDRAVAIVGAAWVEEALSDSIVSFLRAHEDSHRRLFKGNAPLGTFSSKIDLSRLLGIVSNAIWADLHRIRDIRNEFAHHIAHKVDNTRLTFATGHIADKCLVLRCVAHEAHSDPRTAYTRACATLNADFDLFTLIGDKVSDSHMIVARGAE
jgi:DNA-binding MltR family transcriptional regulator